MPELIKIVNASLIFWLLLALLWYINKQKNKILTVSVFIIVAFISLVLISTNYEYNSINNILGDRKLLIGIGSVIIIALALPLAYMALKKIVCKIRCRKGKNGSQEGGGGGGGGGKKPKKPQTIFNPIEDAYAKGKELPIIEILLDDIDVNKLDKNYTDNPPTADYPELVDHVVGQYTTAKGEALLNAPFIHGKLNIKTSSGEIINNMKDIEVQTMRVRGNVSRTDSFKSYTLKLKQKIALFDGYDKVDKYDLYCSYDNDSTCIRNAVAMGMGNYMKIRSSPVQYFRLKLSSNLQPNADLGLYVLLETADGIASNNQIIAHTDKFAWNERNMLIGVFPGNMNVPDPSTFKTPMPPPPDVQLPNPTAKEVEKYKYICDDPSKWNSLTNNGHTQGGSYNNGINGYGNYGVAVTPYYEAQAITFAIDKPSKQSSKDEIMKNSEGKVVTNPRVSGTGLQYRDNEPVIIPGVPAPDTIKAMQKLQMLIQQFTKFLLCPDDSMKNKKLSDYIDETNFAKFIICAEIRNDNDTYRHNQYICVNDDDKILLGPLWDMDLSMCNFIAFDGCATEGFRYDYVCSRMDSGEPARGVAPWVKLLMQRIDFLAIVRNIWQNSDIRKKTFDLIDFYVNSYGKYRPPNIRTRAGLQSSCANLYSIYKSGITSCTTYTDSENILKWFLNTRFDWLEQKEQWGKIK